MGKVASISTDKTNYRYAAREVTDGKSSTSWYPTTDKETEELVLDLGAEYTFDRIMLQEPIFLGQRINHFTLYIREADEEWREIVAGTTIGYKRLLRIEEEKARFIKIVFSAAGMRPALK